MPDASPASRDVRSQLFVPGNRADRFDKACQTAADLVCIDLEDAVGSADKTAAREATLGWLADTEHRHVGLRINPLDTDAGAADVRALAGSDLALPFVMIPKAESTNALARLDAALPNALGPFFIILETARGLVRSLEQLEHSRVAYAMYGAVDYAGDVGCSSEWDAHLANRCKLVREAAACGVALLDSPHTAIRDLESLRASTLRAKALGLHARSAIHPAQIPVIHDALSPTPEEVEWAESVMEAFAAAEGNVATLHGEFIEEPVAKRARRILARAHLGRTRGETNS